MNTDTFIPVTIDQCRSVLQRYPDLRANGFHADYKQPVTDLEIRLEAAKSLRFLCDNCIPSKYQWHGSYGLKHRTERWVPPYITNGAFILAADIAAYPIKRDGHQRINALIGLRFVKRYKKLIQYPAPRGAPKTWRELELDLQLFG